MNSPGHNTQVMEVGKRLRELRAERRISLRELGRLSGISVNALSLIERGLTSPSVSTLYRLVDALGVPITTIFRAEPQREEIVFLPVSEHTQVPFPLGVWEGLGGESFVGRLQPFMLTLESRADSGSQVIVHTGHEFVMCLQGLLEYTVEGKNTSWGKVTACCLLPGCAVVGGIPEIWLLKPSSYFVGLKSLKAQWDFTSAGDHC